MDCPLKKANRRLRAELPSTDFPIRPPKDVQRRGLRLRKDWVVLATRSVEGKTWASSVIIRRSSLIFSLGSHCIVWCFPLFWLTVVITLGLVWWQTIETHSRERSSRTMFCFSVCEYMKIMYAIYGFRNENENKSKGRFYIQYLACYISYFTRLLGKYRISRQSRNWWIYHHEWHSKGVPSRGFRIYLRHQQRNRRRNTARCGKAL